MNVVILVWPKDMKQEETAVKEAFNFFEIFYKINK